MAAIDNRPRATYPGDIRSAVGQVVGPTLAGELLVVDDVEFDPVAGKSVARFRYATTPDVTPDVAP